MTLLTLLTFVHVIVTFTTAVGASRHWGPTRPVTSEYSTYSPSLIKVYKDGHLISSTDNGAGSHYSHITAEVSAFGQTFVLRLVKNRYLFSTSYVERVVTDAGQTYRQTNNLNAGHCFYIGSVDNYPSSTASASTCYGFLGEFTVGNETYSVEPVDETLTGAHRVYKESDSIQLKRHVCGNTGTTGKSRRIDKRSVFHLRKKRALRWPQDLDGTSKFVEFYVVNDVWQYINMDNDTAKTITRAKTIVNAASALYHPESIYIALVGVEVWTTGNPILYNATEKVKTLSEFCSYRQHQINPYHHNDNAQLITNFDFDGDTIGLAYTYTMCNYWKSCAWTHDYSTMPGATAAVLAHEMGHNFGFNHDDELRMNCACDDGQGKCIMNSYVSKPPATRWSQCSKDRLWMSLDEDLDYCLHNIPQTIYDNTPDCGNGIVDQGEDCDCGSAPTSQCNRGCCFNCRLTPSAACAYGRCCDVPTCQLKPSYTECRSANGPCDLAEYCNGTDPLCPSDVYRRNTDSCTVNGVSAYCYNGECRTRQSQCRLWAGDSVDSSADICYTSFNIYGLYGANCGYNFTTHSYFKCSSSDALCGSLQCDIAQGSINEFVNFKASLSVPVYRSVDGKRCTTASYRTFYNGPDRPDPGYVPDGAACGTEKMCLKHSCVNVSSVSTVDCGNCSMRGVCNGLGQCHCEIGFKPPDCSQPGGGGSYHSNPASPYPIPNTTTVVTTISTTVTDDLMTLYVIIGAVVGTVVLLAVVITVIIVLITKSASSSSAAAAAAAAVPQSPAPPAVVGSRPSGIHPRFVPSQHRSPGYSGFHNNGYCDNEPPSSHDHYPYFYHSRITVHSD